MTPISAIRSKCRSKRRSRCCFGANEAALKVKGVRFVTSGLQLLREIKTLRHLGRHQRHADLRSRRARLSARRRSATATFRATSRSSRRAARGGNTSSRSTCPATPSTGRRSPSKSSARRRSRPGQYDLILEPTNLWLTIHESIGHPTELDRAMGYEANYAGTSFIAPPEKMIGKLKYGPEFMNIQADRTQEGLALARGVGRRRRARGPVADHREGHVQGLSDDARAGGVDSEAHRRATDRTAARSPSRGTRCSSSACRTSR